MLFLEVYDFATHTRRPKSDRIEPRDFVVVDGILILSQVIESFSQVFVRFPEDPFKMKEIRNENNQNVCHAPRIILVLFISCSSLVVDLVLPRLFLEFPLHE